MLVICVDTVHISMRGNTIIASSCKTAVIISFTVARGISTHTRSVATVAIA